MPQCVPHHAPNERDYGKTIVEINSSMTAFSASFLWQYNYTWEYHHLFLELLWVVKDYRNLCLIKTNRSMFRSRRKFCRKPFLTPSFVAAMLLSFVCEYCPPSDNNLLLHSTNIILIKSSFWRSVHVYWQTKQHNNIWQFPPKGWKVIQEKQPRLGCYCNWVSCSCNAANLIKLGPRTYAPLVHLNIFPISMHVSKIILLALKQLSTCAVNLL